MYKELLPFVDKIHKCGRRTKKNMNNSHNNNNNNKNDNNNNKTAEKQKSIREQKVKTK